MGSQGPSLLARYDDFRGGEWGRLDGDSAAANQWTGTNCLVSKSGAIYKRPGFTNLGESSWGDYVPKALGWNPATSKIWTITSDSGVVEVYQCNNPSGGAAAYSGVNPVVPTSGQRFDWVDDGDIYTYVTSFGNETYRFKHDTAFVKQLGGAGVSPGGRAITIFGARLVVGGTTLNPNRIWYSKPYDYDSGTSWPADNFIDIGRSGDTIAGLDTIRDTMIVTMADGDIYTVTGTLGTNEYVRRFTPLGYTGANITANTIATTQRGLMWRLRRRPTASGTYDSTHDQHHPQSFDGASLRDIDTLTNWYTETGDAGVVFAAEMLDDAVFAMGNGDFLLLRDGVWTKHQFTVTTVGDVYGSRVGRNLGFAFERTSDRGKWIALNLSLLDDPTNDQDEGAFTAQFSTSWRRAKNGEMVTPRHVLVELDAFKAPDARTVAVTLNYHGIYEGTSGDRTSATQTRTITEPADPSQRYALRYSFEPAHPCQAFSVTCTIDGVRVDAISVYGQTDPVRLP